MDDWTLTRKDKQEATTQPSSQDHWHFGALLDLFFEVFVGDFAQLAQAFEILPQSVSARSH